MNSSTASSVVELYYHSFNQGQFEAMLNLLDDHVIHDINQGDTETGKETFKLFLQKMNLHYKEQVKNLTLFYTQSSPLRIAAEFDINGSYLVSDADLPPANNQSYLLRVGAFFELNPAGLISRVSNHYNLQNWIRQVSSPTSHS
jgi:steroid delta-isomerase-like uncharacterized protein